MIAKIKKYTPKVIVFGPIAEYDEALPRVLAQSLYRNDPSLIAKHLLPSREKMDQDMQKAIVADGTEYISVYQTLCPNGTCSLWTADGNPIQSDYGHLTNLGSREMVNRMRDLIVPRTAMIAPAAG
jgi:hypothetical protein